MIEILVSIAALVAIGVAGRQGAATGFFTSVVTAILSIFAMIVALRFWFPMAVWLSEMAEISPDEMAFGAFWTVFVMVFVPFYGLLRSLNERVIPAYPVAVDRAFGFLAGCVFGAVLVSTLATSLLPFLPKLLPGYDPSRMLLPIDRTPVAVYRGIQAKAAGWNCATDEVIVFPELSRSEDGELTSTWQ